MAFINSIVKVAKKEGISPRKAYSQANQSCFQFEVELIGKPLEDTKGKNPFKELSTIQLYMHRPMD